MRNKSLLPEWSTVSSVLIAWPFQGSDWDSCFEAAQTAYADILAVLSRYTRVQVLVHPSILESVWREEVGHTNPDWANIVCFNDIAYDDTWVRDYGPISRRSGYIDFSFDGWGKKYSAYNDNRVNAQLLAALESTFVSDSLVLEGGALEVNSQGVLLANKDCVLDRTRNPDLTDIEIESRLRDQLGLVDIVWLSALSLTGDDTDGHIDTLARFVDDTTLIYAGRNPSHPDADVLERLHQQIQTICDARDWSAIELPTPEVYSELDGRLLPATYTNFLRVNDVVFVPIYQSNHSKPESDREALAVLERAFPDSDIVPVNCLVLLEQQGSLHCATMQLHHS